MGTAKFFMQDTEDPAIEWRFFNVGVLPRVGLKPRTIGQQPNALTVRPLKIYSYSRQWSPVDHVTDQSVGIVTFPQCNTGFTTPPQVGVYGRPRGGWDWRQCGGRQPPTATEDAHEPHEPVAHCHSSHTQVGKLSPFQDFFSYFFFYYWPIWTVKPLYKLEAFLAN